MLEVKPIRWGLPGDACGPSALVTTLLGPASRIRSGADRPWVKWPGGA
ncbi:hypothetical protein [Actinoplanes xinjiangensis]